MRGVTITDRAQNIMVEAQGTIRRHVDECPWCTVAFFATKSKLILIQCEALALSESGKFPSLMRAGIHFSCSQRVLSRLHQ
jgi:hypothetical protein